MGPLSVSTVSLCGEYIARAEFLIFGLTFEQTVQMAAKQNGINELETLPCEVMPVCLLMFNRSPFYFYG